MRPPGGPRPPSPGRSTAAGRREPAAPGVAGDAAAEAVSALVAQFSQRGAFIRELVQNSLDAGAGAITLAVRARGAELEVEVTDDGEGMDRATIEGCLLTLFRSSKEHDLTKIGKFGVGFVSLFAVHPRAVVVDTARDGVHHRVVFDPQRRYTLLEVDEPFEGTSVVLRIPTEGPARAALAEELRAALWGWCRFARAELWLEGEGPGWSWPRQRVSAPFEVDAPVTIFVEEPGLRASLGLSGARPSLAAWVNRGLILLEGPEDLVPGVAFRVEAAGLEHTLTRDNVVRDAAHAAIVARVRALAEGPLRAAWHRALADAVAADDEPARERLLALAVPGGPALPDDLPCLRESAGERRSWRELRPGLLRRARARVLEAPAGDPLAEALAAAGHRVLRPVDAEVAHRLGAGPRVRAAEAHVCPGRAEPTPVLRAAAALGLRARLEPDGVFGARFTDRGAALAGRWAVRQRRPFAVEEAGAPLDRGALLIDVDHPVAAALLALPPDQGAPLLLHAARRAAGDAGPMPDALPAALAAADEARDG